MGASVTPGGTDKELLAGLREDMFLDDVGTKMKEADEQAKKAAEEAEAKRKADLEAKARAEAEAARPEDPRVKALQEALKISEEARQRAAAIAQPAPPREDKPPEPELTTEQLNELFRTDPASAIDKMMAKREKVLAESLDKRLGSLAASTASSAREAAERKYPDEFRMFARDIEEFVAKGYRLQTMENWDDAISYIRGRPGNFDKYITERDAKAKAKAEEEAKAREAASAGAHASSVTRPPPPVAGQELDDTAKEIARTLNPGLRPEQAYAEYNKWRGVTT